MPKNLEQQQGAFAGFAYAALVLGKGVDAAAKQGREQMVSDPNFTLST